MKGQAIRELMFALIGKGRTKSEVADILGISRNTVHKWLRQGNIRLPRRGPRLEKRKLTVEQENAVDVRHRSCRLFSRHHPGRPGALYSASFQHSRRNQHRRPYTKESRLY